MPTASGTRSASCAPSLDAGSEPPSDACKALVSLRSLGGYSVRGLLKRTGRRGADDLSILRHRAARRRPVLRRVRPRRCCRAAHRSVGCRRAVSRRRWRRAPVLDRRSRRQFARRDSEPDDDRELPMASRRDAADRPEAGAHARSAASDRRGRRVLRRVRLRAHGRHRPSDGATPRRRDRRADAPERRRHEPLATPRSSRSATTEVSRRSRPTSDRRSGARARSSPRQSESRARSRSHRRRCADRPEPQAEAAPATARSRPIPRSLPVGHRPADCAKIIEATRLVAATAPATASCCSSAPARA